MVIASRTPEGQPGRCPVCGSAARVEPSAPSGDAPCPSCGHLLWFTAEEEGDTLVLRLGDRRDAEALGRLVSQLVEGPSRRVVLDLDGVRYFTSSELAALLRLPRWRRDTRLTLRGLHPDLREVFRITRLDQVLSIEE